KEHERLEYIEKLKEIAQNLLFYIDEKKEAYKFCQDNGFEPVILSITIERLNCAGEKIKADIQAEFDAENSKKKPNQEKLVELREKYIRVFGVDPVVKPQDDKEIQQSSFYGLTVEYIANKG
ncbi:transposase, partial [Francisella tularensis]